MKRIGNEIAIPIKYDWKILLLILSAFPFVAEIDGSKAVIIAILNESGKFINGSTFPLNIPYWFLASLYPTTFDSSFTIVVESIFFEIDIINAVNEIGIATFAISFNNTFILVFSMSALDNISFFISGFIFIYSFIKYVNSAMFPKVVDKLLIAAILSVFVLFVIKTISSIVEIVNIVFTNWSIPCALAVVFIDSLPLKYPFNTEITDTRNIDGLSAIIDNFASFICKYWFAKMSANEYKK